MTPHDGMLDVVLKSREATPAATAEQHSPRVVLGTGTPLLPSNMNILTTLYGDPNNRRSHIFGSLYFSLKGFCCVHNLLKLELRF